MFTKNNGQNSECHTKQNYIQVLQNEMQLTHRMKYNYHTHLSYLQLQLPD